ncbi:MAG: tannase/feruloyl esterase family alpha/beta hydrolase [Cyclobacteriaceae bacterium]|nr:tannase/feruloyl esterase family alpha/beta hydrolase [Cyclobacteriaceae bacterium]
MKKFPVFTTLIFCLAGIINPFTIFGSGVADTSPCVPCSSLKELHLPEVTITSAGQVEKGKVHCRVTGVIGKEINFELLLPDSWNGRFVMGGGGGFVGSVQNMAKWTLDQGYATSGTDTGHKGPGIKADWAFQNMERQLNFGYMGVHRTAVVSKAIIALYYCSSPEYSYFMGCSRGGGQALMEAQRYPEDFDGIVAGAPAFSWPAMGAEIIQNMQACYPNPNYLEEGIVTPANLKLLQAAVLKQCDKLDGVKDGILNDPRDCAFNFSKLPTCPPDQPGDDCFTLTQLEAIKTIYKGVNSEGKMIYPGFPFGGEAEQGGWQEWITGPNEGTMTLNFPSAHFGFGTETFKYLIYNDPAWDYSTFDFTTVTKEMDYASAYLDATSTDYSGFKARGGKLILYHGWNDAALSALSTINHYEAVKEGDENVMHYMRLYLLPGVLHCGGGPGPGEVDWLALVREWVEKDMAPERVVVSKTLGGQTTLSRPVFPYPRKAVYDGKGDTNKEASFHE